jgi:hypothetical protein
MSNAMKLHSTDFTLYALFCLSRLNLPLDAAALGRLSGRDPAQIAGDLLHLSQLGHVASSAAGGTRLTLLGLARAAQLEPMVARASPSAAQRVLRPRKTKIKPMMAARPRSEQSELPALSA